MTAGSSRWSSEGPYCDAVPICWARDAPAAGRSGTSQPYVRYRHYILGDGHFLLHPLHPIIICATQPERIASSIVMANTSDDVYHPEWLEVHCRHDHPTCVIMRLTIAISSRKASARAHSFRPTQLLAFLCLIIWESNSPRNGPKLNKNPLLVWIPNTLRVR